MKKSCLPLTWKSCTQDAVKPFKIKYALATEASDETGAPKWGPELTPSPSMLGSLSSSCLICPVCVCVLGGRGGRKGAREDKREGGRGKGVGEDVCLCTCILKHVCV